MGGSELFAGLLDGRRVTNVESLGAIVGAVTGGSAFSAVLVADGGILAGNGVVLARREALETSRGEVKICAGGEVFGLIVANVLLTSRELSSTDGNSIAKVSCLFTGRPVPSGSGPKATHDDCVNCVMNCVNYLRKICVNYLRNDCVKCVMNCVNYLRKICVI